MVAKKPQARVRQWPSVYSALGGVLAALDRLTGPHHHPGRGRREPRLAHGNGDGPLSSVPAGVTPVSVAHHTPSCRGL